MRDEGGWKAKTKKRQVKISAICGNKYNKKQDSRRGNSCSPVLLYGKVTTGRAGRPRNIIMCTEGQKEMRTMNNSVTLKIRGGCSLWVLN